MSLVSRRPRLLAIPLLASVAAATLFATRGAAPVATVVHAGALQATPADLGRPAWFRMRVLSDHIVFTAPTVLPAGPEDLPAAAGILVDVDSGAVLWQRNAHQQLPPASTTKILTALVALENLSPRTLVTITPSALHQAGDETRMGIAAGQRYTVAELLTGMLVVSGNDAATALAEDTVGLERFVGAMNAQATALGLTEAHFTSPVGLQDGDHHASAYDLAVISAAAVRHFPLFDSIVATQDATLAAAAGHPEFDLHSVNLLLSLYPYATGIKPGWTGAAGNCEVGMAVRDGHRLISVLLNAPYDFHNSRRLLDWGFQREGLTSTLPTPTPTPSPPASPSAHA